MSGVGTTVLDPPSAQTNARNRIVELKVSGYLMTLDTGLFCVSQAPGSPTANERTGLPGVHISLPPGPVGRPEVAQIRTFREDGWMNSSDAAVLISVAEGPAQVLVTVYQSPSAPPEAAPRLQVMRLDTEPGVALQGVRPAAAPPVPANSDVVAHVQGTGDVSGKIGEWVGTRGSGLWIEGFSLAPNDLKPEDIEYQAVLGRGWLSPWIEGGKFCGSRGMALPLLGLTAQLKGAVAKTHECSYSATFVDGSAVGPVSAGEPCATESLAAMEAFQLVIHRRGGVAVPSGRTKSTAAGKPAPGRAARSR
jgi:hypothetical protein